MEKLLPFTIRKIMTLSHQGRELNTVICNYDNSASNNRQTCHTCERGLSVLVGIIGGIVFTAVAVLLFINGFLTSAGFAGWVALITALVFLAGLIVAAAVSEKGRECIGCYLGSLVFGIFGTIFSGYLSISADITAGTVFPAVIVGLPAFFFAYMIISRFFLLRCLSE